MFSAIGDHTDYFHAETAQGCFSDKTIKHAVDYINENNYKIKGDIYGSTFYAKREHGKLKHTSHLWIPIG